MGRPGAVQCPNRTLLRGEAADLDGGAEAVTAGLAKPAVANTAFVHKSGTFRHELLMIALRAKGGK